MEDERKFPNFRDEVARAIHEADPDYYEPDWANISPYMRGICRTYADAALTRLRQLGAFHVDALTAIKEQEKE